ncbi:MAG: helix-turn-helix domain-containing protein [Actinomycetota bacterium]|nr:helix-turn-helix domain-containing protein [Actinomycetota bacterium]
MTSSGSVAEQREPLLSKRQIAEHYGYSTRWVEYQMRKGLPTAGRRGGHQRYRLSQVEAWFEAQEAA